ncbi:MAG: ATP-binding protein [candidate division WOR-3 bacterium]
MLAFNEARETDCVLLFDEADSLFACRLTESRSVDRMHNYMTNILMQELERFDGVVILTTNREYAFDEAFPRRILYKIKFDIPGPAERARIWRALIPPEAPLAPDVDFNLLAEKYALTGGEIKNVIIKAALEGASQNSNMLSMALFTKYAEIELENTDRKVKRHIGFRND